MPKLPFNKANALFLAFIASLFSNAAAAETEQDDDDMNNFIVLGVASTPEFEGASSNQWVPFGVASLNFGNLQLEVRGLEGTLNMLGGGTRLKMGPAFSLTTPRDEIIPGLPTFGEVDFAVELGGFIGFETPFGSLPEGSLRGQLSVRHDILGAHNGFLVTPELEYFFAVNRLFRVGASVNATWASNDYMSTYFDITPEQNLISGLNTFSTGSGVKDVGLEVYSILSFSEQLGIFSRASYNRLLGDAADNPIVQEYGDKNQFFVGAGVFYRF